MTDADAPNDSDAPVSTPDDDLSDQIAGVLSDPVVWTSPPQAETAVIAAIAAASAATTLTGSAARDRPHMSAGRRRRHLAPALVGTSIGLVAAAVVVIAVLAIGVVELDVPGDDPPATTEIVLDGVGAEPDARAHVAVHDLRNGARIVLDVTGLPPAPPGEWYEMDIVRPDGPPVGAGSFHMRGGDGPVVLWSGVGIEGGQRIDVMRQPQGTVVLSGEPTND